MPVLQPLTKNGQTSASNFNYSQFSGSKNVLPPLTTNRKIFNVTPTQTTNGATATKTTIKPNILSTGLGFANQFIKEPVVGQSIQFAKGVAENTINFTKSFIKSAKEKPIETAKGAVEGAGVEIIKTGGQIAKLVQDGIKQQVILGVPGFGLKPRIPDRFDMSKQLPAFEELVSRTIEKRTIPEKNGYAVGSFIGSFLPYALAGEITSATVGTKILLPAAEKFLPQAIKFIPSINNAIGFLGVGQLQYDKNVDETRLNRVKNDLIMLGLFETTGLLAKGLSKGTKNIISNIVNKSSSAIKSSKGADMDILEQGIQEAKNAIKKDTGKNAESVLSNNMVKSTDKQINQEIQDQARIQQYREQFKGKLLNTDNVREVYKPEGYNRSNSAQFHERSSALSDRIFGEDVSQLKPGDNYLFTAGGSGAGKSSALEKYPGITKDFASGLDSNFSSPNSLKKLDRVIEKGAHPKIVFVYREPIDAWDNGVVKRAIDPENGRVVPLDVFLKNTEDSPKTVLQAYKKYGDKVDIQVIDNSHGAGNAQLVNDPIAFLKKISYNINDVKSKILKSTEDQVQKGSLSEETAKNLLGSQFAKEPQLQRKVGENATVKVPREQLPVKTPGAKEKASRLEARITESLNKTPEEVKSQLGELYTQMNKKDQIEKAVNYVISNPDDALAILRGEKEAPKGLLKNSIYVAMENQAVGDVELARKLASLASTRAGQELSILTELNPNSPVKAIRDVINIREQVFKERIKKPINQAIKDEATKIKTKIKAPDKYDWNNFIKSIQC